MVSSSLAPLDEKILRTIDQYNMLENIHSVIVGVSGGADSMALLRFFEAYSKEHNLRIVAAHVNHCLRGEESERDEAFVRTYCKENKIPLEVSKVDVNAAARRDGLGIEECARKIRYEFFEGLAARFEGKIATAHTLSDTIETTLMNLARGTGPAGLCGIPPTRGNIIRPLIHLKRAETQHYCELSGISYVTDSTNLLPEYTRNKVRLEVVPLLRQINPEFEDNAARTLELLRADEDYLSSMVKLLIEECTISPGVFNISKVKARPLPILSRVIRQIVFELVKTNVSARHIELILSAIKVGSGAVTLPQKIRVSVDGDRLTLRKEPLQNGARTSDFECEFAEGVTLTDTGEEFIIKLLDKAGFEAFLEANRLEFFYALDYEKIPLEAKLRHRRAGDKFSQAGRGVTKSIKKLFNELKVPQGEREKILMLANGNEILWVDGVDVSQQATPTEATRKIVLIYSKEKNIC